MSITFVASSSNTRTGGTSLTLTKPATVQQDDILVVILGYRSGGATVTAPAGWVLIRRDANGGAQGQAALYKIAGASEPASYIFTLSSSTNITGGLLVVRSANTVTPINAHAASILTTDNVSAIAPSVTTTKNNCGLIVAFSAKEGSSSYTTPTGMTEAWDVFTTGTGGSVCAASYEVLGAAGASGTRASTSLSAHEDIAQTIAITSRTLHEALAAAVSQAAASLVASVNNVFSPATALSTSIASSSTSVYRPLTLDSATSTATVNLPTTSSYKEATNIPEVAATASTTCEPINYKVFTEKETISEATAAITQTTVYKVAADSFGAVASAAQSCYTSVQKIFNPGGLSFCDSVITANALVNAQGSAVAVGISEANSASIVENTMEAAVFGNALAIMGALVNNEDSSLIYAQATAEAFPTVYRLFQSSPLTSQAEANIADIILIRTVSPNVILGIGETTLLNGSTRLPSQSGLGVTVDPVNANLNVNIIRIL